MRMMVVFEKGAPVVTLEEHVLQGGFGSAVLEWASQNQMATPVSVMAVEDRFIQHGDHKHLLAEVGLDDESIIQNVRKVVDCHG